MTTAVFFFSKLYSNIFHSHLIRCLIFYPYNISLATAGNVYIISSKCTRGTSSVFVGNSYQVTIIIGLNCNIPRLKIYRIISVNPMASIDNTVKLTAIACQIHFYITGSKF